MRRCEKLEGLSPPAFKSGGATAPPCPPFSYPSGMIIILAPNIHPSVALTKGITIVIFHLYMELSYHALLEYTEMAKVLLEILTNISPVLVDYNFN